MNKIVFIAALVILTGCASIPLNEKTDRADTETYPAIADRIVKKVLDLQSKYPFLNGMGETERTEPDVWISIIFSHGIIGKRPNPEWKPGKKVSRTLPVFAEDGIDLVIYVYTGMFPGACAPPTTTMGELNVSFRCIGPMGPAIKEEIDRIIAEEQKRILNK